MTLKKILGALAVPLITGFIVAAGTGNPVYAHATEAATKASVDPGPGVDRPGRPSKPGVDRPGRPSKPGVDRPGRPDKSKPDPRPTRSSRIGTGLGSGGDAGITHARPQVAQCAQGNVLHLNTAQLRQVRTMMGSLPSTCHLPTIVRQNQQGQRSSLHVLSLHANGYACVQACPNGTHANGFCRSSR